MKISRASSSSSNEPMPGGKIAVCWLSCFTWSAGTFGPRWPKSLRNLPSRENLMMLSPGVVPTARRSFRDRPRSSAVGRASRGDSPDRPTRSRRCRPGRIPGSPGPSTQHSPRGGVVAAVNSSGRASDPAVDHPDVIVLVDVDVDDLLHAPLVRQRLGQNGSTRYLGAAAARCWACATTAAASAQTARVITTAGTARIWIRMARLYTSCPLATDAVRKSLRNQACFCGFWLANPLPRE